MSGKLSKFGYLLIDHRGSPGLDECSAHQAGLSGLPVGSGKLFEANTYTCSHCCAVVIINPLRQRDRAYCAKCDHYICDCCGAAMAASGVCVNIDRLFDFVQDSNAKLEDRGISIVGLPDLSPLYTTVKVSVTSQPPES